MCQCVARRPTDVDAIAQLGREQAEECLSGDEKNREIQEKSLSSLSEAKEKSSILG